MRHSHHGCGPRGHIEIDVPEGLFAMRGGRGWQLGTHSISTSATGPKAAAGAAVTAAAAAGCSRAASFGSCC